MDWNRVEADNEEQPEQMEHLKRTLTVFREYPEILTVHDIQNMLRISRHAAYDIVHSGAIPSRKIGRVYRIKKADLLAFLANDASQR